MPRIDDATINELLRKQGDAATAMARAQAAFDVALVAMRSASDSLGAAIDSLRLANRAQSAAVDAMTAAIAIALRHSDGGPVQ